MPNLCQYTPVSKKIKPHTANMMTYRRGGMMNCSTGALMPSGMLIRITEERYKARTRTILSSIKVTNSKRDRSINPANQS